MESLKRFNFKNKNEFHQFVIKHPNFLKTLIDIQNSSGIFGLILKPNDVYEYFMKNAKGKNQIFFYYLDKKPIGVIYGYKAPFEKNEFTVSMIAIKKEYQKNGHGKIFIRKAYDNLAEQGFTQFGMVSEKGTRVINQIISNGRKYKLESSGTRDKVIVRPKLRHILK
ncbi:MAG TPA: GNAT family N-acetyltransferase [archaeon]|nr:GNAT family N-acetyltransferase [archaeon]